MDHSWRPRPPFQGNICPTCSMSHFPFCPPRPIFNENPRCQPHNDYFLDRPRFDPFLDNRGPVPNFHCSFGGDHRVGYADRPPWLGNPNFNGNPYDNEYHYEREDFGHCGYDIAGVKRMRMNDRDYGTSLIGGERYANGSRFLSENERMLKLVHDHGNSSCLIVQGGPSLLPEMSPEANGYMRERFQELREVRDLNSHHGLQDELTFRKSQTHGDRDDEFQKYQQMQPVNSLSHPFGYINHSHQQSVSSTNFEQAKQNQFEGVRCHEGSISYDSVSQKSDLKPQSALSQSAHYPETSGGKDHNFHPESHYSILHHATNQPPPPYTNTGQSHSQPVVDFSFSGFSSNERHSSGVNIASRDGVQGSHSWPLLNEERPYRSSDLGPRQPPHLYGIQPPPCAKPLRSRLPEHLASSPPHRKSPSLFPITVSSSLDVPLSHPPVTEPHSLPKTCYENKTILNSSSAFTAERYESTEKPKFVDASLIFKHPHRSTRPDHLVIILRGLPGSGKSYLVKMLRDLEVENGGDAPRIHCMDEYFMTEVEKEEENDMPKPSGSLRGKKPFAKTVMEYCYEPEMEEAYRSSMLKAFKKTLDDGVFSFVIVDDRNLRVADFAQFWATAKRAGYEVYLLEATYKDPAGCAARNVHGFTLDDIQNMAGQWEEAPSLYLKLDIKSLFHGDDLEESGIQEVDMDVEDENPEDGLQGPEVEDQGESTVPPTDKFESSDFATAGSLKDDKQMSTVEKHPIDEVNELKRSKWSDELDEDESDGAHCKTGSSLALSGLIQAYSKGGKSVRWGDQVGGMGFSIGAAKRANLMSLVIGPGPGYNLKSNPLSEEESMTSARDSSSSGPNVFQERMRAENESFKAVFEKRRQRIGGLGMEED